MKAALAATLLLAGCATEPDPMRTSVTPNPRYNPPGPSQPVVNPSNPPIVGESAWGSEAAKWIGVPYRAGGDSRAGMDAMTLVRRMYENVARIVLPKDIGELSRTGFAIPRDQLRPGDLVFFEEDGKVNHVGIFLGDGRIVHADSARGVMYSLLTDPELATNYKTARRILR